MFDTMTLTKIIGGLCGTFLVFLLGSWAAQTVYGTGEAGHGEHEQAYTVAIPDKAPAADAAAPADAGPSFEEVFASADATAGEAVFRNCRTCHKLEDGANATGPSLYGVVGRQVDTEAGYTYSGALEAVFDVWTPEHLNTFLTNPKAAAPGTKMSFAGLSKVQDRANLIAYLATNPGGS